MFCPQCGKEIGTGKAFCVNCGAPAVAAPPASSAPASTAAVGEKVKSRSLDALKAIKIIAVDPVSGPPEAFAALEKRQALEVGIVFAAAFEICAVVGLYLALPRWSGSPALVEILKLLILGVVPFAATAGASALARQIFRASGGSIEADVFIAGTAILPLGIVCLLSGIMGIANFEVVAIVFVFALSYSILVLYAGCTRISGLSGRLAAPAVPIIVLIAGWLSKILLSAML
jgi:hypothetical protein